MRAKLLYRDGYGRDAAIDLPLGGGYLGRATDCLVRTDDPTVSRYHAAVRFSAGQWICSDIEGGGVTQVNEREIVHAVLQHGDVIRCGSLLMRFFVEQPQPVPQPAPPLVAVAAVQSAPPVPAPPLPPASASIPVTLRNQPVPAGLSRPPAATPPAQIPNPEARPVQGFVSADALSNQLVDKLVFDAYVFSRSLLNDKKTTLAHLVELLKMILAAHAVDQAAELALLSRWANDGIKLPDKSDVLQDLCDRIYAVIRSATMGQRSLLLYGFRVFLRALRDAFIIQARIFGLEYKLEAKAESRAKSPALSMAPRSIADAWAAVYLGSIMGYFGGRSRPGDMPTSFAAARSMTPLKTSDPRLHQQIVSALSVGTPALLSSNGQSFLLCGYSRALDRYCYLRLESGRSELVPRQQFMAGQDRLDFLLVDEVLANPDLRACDLRPADSD